MLVQRLHRAAGLGLDHTGQRCIQMLTRFKRLRALLCQQHHHQQARQANQGPCQRQQLAPQVACFWRGLGCCGRYRLQARQIGAAHQALPTKPCRKA